MTSTESGPQGRWAGNTLAEFERDLADNLCYQRGTTAESASALDAYWTLAVTVRDRLADRRARTARANYEANPKFVYYLSAEYMLGRQFSRRAPPHPPTPSAPRPGSRPPPAPTRHACPRTPGCPRCPGRSRAPQDPAPGHPPAAPRRCTAADAPSPGAHRRQAPTARPTPRPPRTRRTRGPAPSSSPPAPAPSDARTRSHNAPAGHPRPHATYKPYTNQARCGDAGNPPPRARSVGP